MRFLKIYHPIWVYIIYVGLLIIPFIGMFSLFDYVNDTIQIESKPTALANFNGR